MILQKNSKVALSGRDFYHLVSPDQIMYCQKEYTHTRFYLADGEEIIVPVTINKALQVLGKVTFIRSHKQYLVNVRYIKGMQLSGKSELTLINGVILPVARSRKKAVTRFLENNIRIQIR